MTLASPDMENYFSDIDSKLAKCYKAANKARALGFDPEDKVDIPLAKNLAERVEGLISAVKPEIISSGLAQRIEELEKEHGVLSLGVAMIIAHEVSEGKFCGFNGKLQAMETGIRTGFAYLTTGVVSAPLEGFTELKIKKRADGKEYFAAMFSGPVRGAGGTATAFCLIVADYVRRKHGYSEYDPTEQERSRIATEMDDYHDRVTNLQYKPSPEEIKYLVRNCPVEVDGSPTEKLDVSQFKDIPRIETNRIRGGVCLVLSMLALKAQKIRKELDNIRNNFGTDWSFIDEFLKLQSAKKDKSEPSKEDRKIFPDYTFISDLVAGRPVLTYPLRVGGFRLRYGRTRMSGYSAAAISPATMLMLDRYIATGTQLKVERPGKAAAITPCDSIDGSIVKLLSGTVIRLDTEAEAKNHLKDVAEILYLGDFLVSYGDFYDRNHVLVPPGYCEEWHMLHLEAASKAPADEKTQKLREKYALTKFPDHPSSKDSIEIAKTHKIPLAPRYTYFWNSVKTENISGLLEWMKRGKLSGSKLILPLTESKRTLELIGLPHEVINKEFAVIGPDDAEAILFSLGLDVNLSNVDGQLKTVNENPGLSALEVVNKLCPVKIMDKGGTFIGARMGRPEKAKMRKLTGKPHVLFPVGKEGGRLRSFRAAIEKGKVTADFPRYKCEKCKTDTVYRTCEKCNLPTEKILACKICGKSDTCIHSSTIDIKAHFNSARKRLKNPNVPELIKGVRGTSNRDHIPENLLKGILRARNDVYVNKDGTTRFDMSELPITHFRPKEIGTPVEKLLELGYSKDSRGRPLESESQVLELKPQDLILPLSPDSIEDSADKVMFNVAKFVDELLESLYGQEPFYKLNSRPDVVGHLAIGLAPHISAGVTGRIIGFSRTQTLLAHPLFHAAMRRDADGDEACVILAMDALLNFSRQYLPDTRGAKTMDSPLVLTARIIPAEVDDMVHRFDVGWRYPLELYEAASAFKMPYEIKIELLGSRLSTERQYEGLGYSNGLSDMNSGVLCSAYKILPSMEEKLKGQMALANRIMAVDSKDVARLVIEKHLLKDIRGNLRKFSNQQFRCPRCNKKFRRPLISGSCDGCNNDFMLTVSEGSIVKYLEPAMSLAKEYSLSDYLKQVLELTKQRIADTFGKEKDRQQGLGDWFG